MTDPDAARQPVGDRVAAGIARIDLMEPPAHCHSHGMMRQLDDAILKARFDEDVHVIRLRGAGEGMRAAIDKRWPDFKGR